jgi:hypothetical protein
MLEGEEVVMKRGGMLRDRGGAEGLIAKARRRGDAKIFSGFFIGLSCSDDCLSI